MKKTIVHIIIFFAGLSISICHAQSDRLSLDTYFEQNFFIKGWASDKRLSAPLISGSTDLAFRLNYDVSNTFGLWGQLSMLFGHGSKMEPRNNYLNLFHNIDIDNYYLLKSKSDTHINYVPSMRVASGIFFSVRYKKWKLSPYVGGGFEDINTAKIRYDLKEKNRNDVDVFSYYWGGTAPIKFLGFVTGEVKFSYTIFPKRDLLIGFVYRQYLTRPEYQMVRQDYYREKEDETLEKQVTKGNLVNSLGVSVGINFR